MNTSTDSYMSYVVSTKLLGPFYLRSGGGLERDYSPKSAINALWRARVYASQSSARDHKVDRRDFLAHTEDGVNRANCQTRPCV